MDKLNILFIEPFYGGSHKNFTDGIIEYSSHNFDLYTLPARYWKWRMRGAALYFYKKIEKPENYDLLFTSDMMSLSDLKMLWGSKCPPSIVYFHENQLSYPLPEGEKMDYQFGFTDITTALAADRLLFNSNFHLNSFIQNMPGFIKKMPEFKPLWVVDVIKDKSSVLYPGTHYKGAAASKTDSNQIPVILWNHRWEFDKKPEIFFNILKKADEILKDDGVETPFNIVLLGENFQKMPKAFIDAKEYFKERILQYGYCKNNKDYYSFLELSDISISTAIQENFGISVVEAIQAGCSPLLPNRLSYPELIPSSLHKDFIYNSDSDLLKKLINILKTKNYPKIESHFDKLKWKNNISCFDEFFFNFVKEITT
ncbi:MAG: DUF3524 domain-containing protein [Spirochaetales bacterium]|nr:DUF3524 domain-containing protein [Spirochaetales bacterium]